MSNEMQITVRIVELRGGGFIIAEEIISGEHVEFDATQAVSSVDEACGAIQRRLRDWHLECKRLRLAHSEDESTRVIAPKRWWRNAE
jgi:hypothetical protein